MEQEKSTAKFDIRGGETFITESPDKVYRVLEGSILVYLAPVSDGTPEGRLFLAEMSEGEVIPGFVASGSWRFVFVALERAEFEELSGADYREAKLLFAKKAGISLDVAADFEEALIEHYNLKSVIEEGYIYNIRREVEGTKERSLNMIRDIFRSKRVFQEEYAGATGHLVYDTAAYLCGYERIHIASADKIRQSSGRQFTLNDIARVSHFTVRGIVLSDKWYRSDYGAFIAFREEDGHPFAMLPARYGSYNAYDADSDSLIRVDRQFAESLSADAVMFYRPFPEEKITVRKLIAFGMQKVYRSDVIRLVVHALAGTLTGLLIPYMNQLVYDRFIPPGNENGLIQLGSVILACALGNITFSVVKNLSSFRAMNSMEYAVQSATIDRLFNLPESFFRQYEAADLGMRTMNISRIYNIVAQSVTNSILSAVFSLAYIFSMLKYSKALAKPAFIMLAVSVGIIIYTGLRQLKYEKEKLVIDTAAEANMFQYINGIAKLRTSSSENRALMQYLGDFTRSRQINIRKEQMTVFVNTFAGVIEVIFSMVFYYLVIKKNLDISIGAFTGFTTAFGALTSAMFEISEHFLIVNQIQPMFDMSRPILETLPESSTGAVLPGELTGDIEVSNISFSYDADEPPVLDGLNLHFSAGEFVGIVGASGCGKSTLLKLLMGFEKPQIGRIYYDGQDIDDIDKRELRRKFGVVLQNGGLITGTIYDNITITAPDCKMERVQEVIKSVGLEEDIADMPMGLYTAISEGSGTISGGQAQRILIARAIVGKPRIIFFDEATSALDNVKQEQVMSTLESLDATKVVIAHRLSTIKNCDRIIVMDNGRIVEEGKYDELMDKKGCFYELAIRQIA